MTLAQVSDALSSSLSQKIQPTFGYYRQPNGWITISPNTRLERLKYTEQGWTYLDAYGAFDMTAYTANHMHEGLFMFGGAKEMTVEEIIARGYYIDPPKVPTCRQHLTQFHRSHTQNCWRGAVPVEFPQLADVPKELIGPFVCDFCQRKMPTREALKQHQSVAHTEPLGNVQMGKSLGDALAAALKGRRPVPTYAPQTTTATTTTVAVATPVATAPVAPPPSACGCGGVYKFSGIGAHKRGRRHREWSKQVAQSATT